MVLFDKIGLLLFYFVWQATLIAFGAGLLLFLFKGADSKVRYAICCFSLFLMITLPVYSSINNFVKDSISVEESTYKQQSVVKTKKVFNNGKLIGTQFRTSRISISPFEELLLYVNKYAFYICIIWMLGVLLTTFYRIYGFSNIRSLIRQAQKISSSFWEARIKELIRKIGIKQGITFLQSEIIDSPAVIGFFKPVLLVPVSFLTGMDSTYIEAILLHELAHIKRYDYIVNTIQLIIEIFGFFHPAVWWISGRIRIERENCCDDYAVEYLGDRLIYVKSLVQLEEMRENHSFITAANGACLSYRVTRLLGKKTFLNSSYFFNIVVPSIVTIFLILSVVYITLNPGGKKPLSSLFMNSINNNPDNSLIAYFPFNGNANDVSVFKQKACSYNVSLCEDRFGRKNSAFDFNGKNSYIITDKNNALNHAKSITVSCWIYPRKTGNWESWISKAGRSKQISEWRMGLGENKNYEWGFTIGNLISGHSMWADYWITSAELVMNKWTHVTVSADRDKNVVTAYMNGEKIGVLNNLRQFDETESPVIIGFQADDNIYYDGKIDEVRIYNRVLSDEEIRKVYNMD